MTAFVQELEAFQQLYQQRGPTTDGIRPRIAVERLREFQRLLREKVERALKFAEGEALFKVI